MLRITGVSLLTGLVCLGAQAFDGPLPPRSIPFAQGGKTYNAYVQTWHPHYAQSNICYYPTSYDPSKAPVLAADGIVQFGYLSLTRLFLNPASQTQSWDSVAFASDGPLCAMFFSGAWNDPLSTPTRLFYQQYGWNDWYFNGQYNYRLNLQTDLVRAVGIDVRANFTYDYAGQFGLGQVVAGQIVVPGSPPPTPDDRFSFPLRDLTPFTAAVSSVMDRSLGTPYTEDGVVRAFNGEEGLRSKKRQQGCYAKLGGGDFGNGFNYVGTAGTGGRAFLCYDGHPGYDYPYPLGTDILAPAAGVLCVADSDTTGPTTGSKVWRDVAVCPLAAPPGQPRTTWRRFHTFYVLHGQLTINGAAAEYMTVYLHSSSLAPSAMAEVQARGYASVSRGQHIAAVGKEGTDGYHLHIEFYKRVAADWERVDPYGDGVNEVLWAPTP